LRVEEPPNKLKDLDFIISRIGMPAVILGVVLWFHFYEFNVFKREMAWDHQRQIRNERAIMQKLGIAISLDSDKHELDK